MCFAALALLILLTDGLHSLRCGCRNRAAVLASAQQAQRLHVQRVARRGDPRAGALFGMAVVDGERCLLQLTTCTTQAGRLSL